jgi:hypothetical protein
MGTFSFLNLFKSTNTYLQSRLHDLTAPAAGAHIQLRKHVLIPWTCFQVHLIIHNCKHPTVYICFCQITPVFNSLDNSLHFHVSMCQALDNFLFSIFYFLIFTIITYFYKVDYDGKNVYESSLQHRLNIYITCNT